MRKGVGGCVGFKQYQTMFPFAFIKAAPFGTAGITENAPFVKMPFTVRMKMSQREIVDVLAAESSDVYAVINGGWIFCDLSVEHENVDFGRVGL